MINTDYKYQLPPSIDLTLDTVFKQCATYEEARRYLLSGQVSTLTPSQKQQLQDFLTINDCDGCLFVFQAMEKNDCRFIQKLIDLGFSINQSFEGKSPLIFYACSLQMFEFLLANNADIDSKSGKETVFSAFTKWTKFRNNEEFEKIVARIIELKKTNNIRSGTK